jgi:hypothetical protein
MVEWGNVLQEKVLIMQLFPNLYVGKWESDCGYRGTENCETDRDSEYEELRVANARLKEEIVRQTIMLSLKGESVIEGSYRATSNFLTDIEISEDR